MIRRALHTLVSTFTDSRLRKSRSEARQTASTGQQSPTVQVTIVGLIRSDQDRQLLSGICGRSGWEVVFADNCCDTKAAVDRVKAPVVLCDRDSVETQWREAIETLASRPHLPCVILLSEAVDTYLWSEVVRGGGYDVLPKPLREDDVIRAVRLARSYWNSPARTSLLSEESSQL
jgi:DNA-binding NtrC family response regulator